jgi:DNA repair photolyase
MRQTKNGAFKVVNPYNRKVSKIPVSPDNVHTIVFWSKNFGPFLDGGYGERLLEMGYHLYFSFTINSATSILEPHVPPLKERLNQLTALCRRFSPQWIDWRFDPICYYKINNDSVHNNIHHFAHIAQVAAGTGIKRCITSFMDNYKKIRRRVQSLSGFSFVDPPLKEKTEILLNMSEKLKELNIQLTLCCEKKLLEALPVESGIKQSSCIPNHRLKTLFGGDISLVRDKGQRVQAGCGCRVSVDIGSYHLHPCHHNCLFCYANPSS